MISPKVIKNVVVELIKKAETSLPGDIESALRKAYKIENDEIARLQLETILKNIEFARRNSLPICQDTGIMNFYISIGDKVEINLSEVKRVVRESVEIATREIPLRPNVVHPLNRENSKDNTGKGIPVIEFEFIPEDFLEISLLIKGAGSENFSSLRMLNPSDGLSGIRDFIIKEIANADGKPCPPIILGVGIGGTSDLASGMAKKALLRPIGSKNGDEEIARFENNLLGDINRLGIGVMGLGGETTCLDVNIEIAHCHTASLPVAINIGCWATRKARARIFEDKVEFID